MNNSETETHLYSLLKEKKTQDLISELKKDSELLTFIDSRGVSLLMLSFYFRNTELSDYILSVKGPSNFYEAATVGDLISTRKFLNADRSLLNTHSRDGFTALGFSTFFNKPEIARYLLAEGADPNIPSSNDFKVAPLHSSVAAKSVEITSMLLRYGANPNVKQQSDVTPLHSAAHNNSPEILKMLLAAGADKNAKTSEGKSVLDFAKEVDSTEMIALLD